MSIFPKKTHLARFGCAKIQTCNGLCNIFWLFVKKWLKCVLFAGGFAVGGEHSVE